MIRASRRVSDTGLLAFVEEPDELDLDHTLNSRRTRIFLATEEANRRALLAAMPASVHGPMLDIGPHDGALTARVAERIGAQEVHGLELIGDHIDAAAARGVTVVQGDVDEGLPYPDGMFGLVFANQVIEHVRRTDNFLQEIRRVLRPDGLAYLSTNNLSSWHNVVALALGHQPMPMHVSDEVIVGNPLNPQSGERHEDLGRTHLRLFTRRALIELAEHHGLALVHSETVGYYPLPAALARAAVRVDPGHGAFMICVFRPA
ncbi:MAG: hypothetical protein QOG68_1389 [Solirubrobacteraceae bacterium]|nr:hypothetical protein [Solirubrobacteraceae bacterium]